MKRLIFITGFLAFSFGLMAQSGSATSWTFPTMESATGSSVTSRTVTATLYVSPDGNDTNGQSWANAYTTIQGALDAASTDANECTLILIAPNATYYDINTTGDPTWAGNYILKGTHRRWAMIKNTHASATSLFKFSGKVELEDLALFSQGVVNGVIFTSSGFRINKCGFNSSTCTAAVKSVHIDGTAAKIIGGKMTDVQMVGHVTYTTGLYMDNAYVNVINDVNFTTCLTAIQVVHADSDGNYFNDMDIGDCALGFDLDAGNGQHIVGAIFHDNTTNIDDEVGDHIWSDIKGSFPIGVTPDDFTGITIPTGDGADLWGTNVEVRSVAAATTAFMVVGIEVEADADEKFRLRLTADDGTTYFEDFQFEGTANAAKRVGASFSSGTGYIFNKGTQIKASSKSESVGIDNAVVWLQIQEL